MQALSDRTFEHITALVQACIGLSLRRARSHWSRLLTGALDGLGPFDVVLLRHVLADVDTASQGSIVWKLLSQLRPGGLLFIGTAEGRALRMAQPQALVEIAPGAFRKPVLI